MAKLVTLQILVDEEDESRIADGLNDMLREEWFEHYAKEHGCELLVLNQERLSPEAEMVQDLMTIVHCFSSRLSGLRNYKKKLKEALEQDRSGAC